MPVKRKTRPRADAANTLRARLHDAEATLKAIQAGEVDALVISGPHGERTLAIEGAVHPYFVLLNAMSDGAILLDASGAILFGNEPFAALARAPVALLRGSRLRELVSPTERLAADEMLGQAQRGHVAGEFQLVRAKGRPIAVRVDLSRLSLDGGRAAPRRTPAVLMAIITDLTYRKAVEATRTRLLERLISAEDDERRRIARELHDETMQSLTALLVGLRSFADLPADACRPVAVRLRDIVARSMHEIGRLARGLHPAVLDDQGLAAAARRYAADFSQAFDTAMEFVAGDVDSPPLPPLASATIYRILQEALTNVARHAGATSVVVELRRDASRLQVSVTDDGAGFDPVGARRATNQLGLRGMSERVRLLGGSMHVQSAARKGTTVRASVPVVRSPPPTKSDARKKTAGLRNPRHDSD